MLDLLKRIFSFIPKLINNFKADGSLYSIKNNKSLTTNWYKCRNRK